jgi:hypothetical protein
VFWNHGRSTFLAVAGSAEHGHSEWDRICCARRGEANEQL